MPVTMSPPSASIAAATSSTWALKAGWPTVRSADLTITKSVTLCGPLRRSSMRRSATTLSGSLARNLLSEVMPPLSSPATLTTARTMSSAYTAMVRQGWSAAVRASRSVSPAPVLKVFACRAMFATPR